jgi:hypothetical protein
MMMDYNHAIIDGRRQNLIYIILYSFVFYRSLKDRMRLSLAKAANHLSKDDEHIYGLNLRS